MRLKVERLVSMKRIIQIFFALLFAAINTLPLASSGIASAEPINLIPNPSVESETSGQPTDWTHSKQGNNTATFTYLSNGHIGNRSLEINMTQRSSGNARWHFTPVDVTPNTTYTYSDWYKSNKTTYLQPVITRTDGSTTNMAQTNVPSSTDWKQITRSINTPANAKSMTVYHLIRSVGKLTTDDFSLNPPATPPTVQITSPANGATVSGTQTISANAADAQGVAGVQFKVDGANFGSEDTVAPYSVDWDTASVADGGHIITATARNTVNLTASTTINIDVQNTPIPPPPPPPVDEENLLANNSFESSANGSSPDSWLKNSWGTNTAQFIYENSGRTGTRSVTTTISQYTSGDAKWYPNPVNVVAGKTYVYRDYYKSNMSNRVVVAFIDGAGNYSYVEQPSATASASWKLYETNFVIPSSAVQATVFHLIDSVGTLTIDDALLQVGVPPPADITVPNGSVEEGTTAPTAWQNNKWGTSTANFQYVTNEGHSGSKSIKVTVSNYVDGDAKWFFTPINTLTPGNQYRFTAWYKGTVQPHVVALYIKADGSEQYVGMPSPLSNSPTTWQKYGDTFTVPQDAAYVSVFMYVAQNGWLQTDDYSITTYSPNGFNRALLTLTFDDGHEDNVNNALPLLNQYGFKTTQCYATTFLESQPQSVLDGALAFYNSGHEICSHTVTHPFLTSLNSADLDYELRHSKEYLESLIGAPVRNFASPYGDYNTTVNDAIDNYYRAHRTVDEGFNSKDNFDIYRLRVQNILDTTSAAQVQAWIEQAQADNTWLILVYHRVADNPGPYDTYKSVFAQHLSVIQNSGITVKTYNDALDEVTAQL